MNLLVKLISLVICVSQWAITLHAQTDCSSPIPLTLVNDEICIDSSSLGESTTTTLYCGLNAAPANEIWFSYTVTQSQNDFTIVPGTLQDAMMVIYENGCAGTGILHCAVPVTGSGVLSYNLGFAVGTQLNIGIFSMSGNDGSFQFCVDSYSNSSANGNGCAGAIPVCEGTTVVDMSTYNSSGIQPSCFAGGAVNQDVWFQFDVLQSGTFDWSASPSGGSVGVELDWALLDITNGCPGTEVACNYNWNGASNNPCGQVAGNTTVCPLSTAGPASAEFCPPSNLVAGNTYAIVVDFYSNSSVGTLDFSILGGSAVIAPYADFMVTPSTAVCDDSLVVSITNSGLGDAMWDYGDGFTYFGSNPPDHVYNTSGIYEITSFVNGLCPSYDTAYVELIDIPLMDSIPDQIVCEGDLFNTVNFTGTIGATFDWTNSNTAIGLAGMGTGDITGFQSSSVSQIQVATIEVTPSLGACVGSPEQFTLTINPLESSAFSYADSTLCTGDFPEPVIISGAQGGTFSSSPNGLTIDNLTGEIDPSTSQVGTYTVSYTTGGQCPSTSTRMFEIMDNPTVDPILDQVVCEGDLFTAVTFSGTAGAIFDWTNSNDSIGLATSGTGDITGFQSSSVSQTENGLITVTPSLGMCIGNPETFELIVIAAPDVSFEGDVLEGCEVHGVNFTNLSSATGDCFWDFGNGVTSSDCGPVYVEYDSGIFDVSLSIEQDGCESTLLLQNYITVHENPIAAFSATPTTISSFDSDVQFYNTSSNSDAYMWDFGDGSFDTIIESPMHTYTSENGNIIVTLWAYNSEFGCADSATLIIGQSEELIYYVPNSFTPDGDTYNEVFKPVFTEGYDPFDFHMIIFNRWGEIVFESFDANGGWNGHYMGKLVQDGTYTWKIDFKETMSDRRHLIVGHVNLLR